MPLAQAALVVAIDFLEWTLDDRLRHASFAALSTDTPAKNISRRGQRCVIGS
jgi:ATP-dependent DNA ligase